MKAMFVNEDGGIRYAQAIVKGLKPWETRTRNMLSALVGERCAVVRTRRGKAPMVVGYVTVKDARHYNGKYLAENRDKTLIPEGSKYDVNGWAKWVYVLEGAEECDPFPLPRYAVRHGRSWCEWNDNLKAVLDVLQWAEDMANNMTDEEWKQLHDGDPRNAERELF